MDNDEDYTSPNDGNCNIYGSGFGDDCSDMYGVSARNTYGNFDGDGWANQCGAGYGDGYIHLSGDGYAYYHSDDVFPCISRIEWQTYFGPYEERNLALALLDLGKDQ